MSIHRNGNHFIKSVFFLMLLEMPFSFISDDERFSLYSTYGKEYYLSVPASRSLHPWSFGSRALFRLVTEQLNVLISTSGRFGNDRE